MIDKKIFKMATFTDEGNCKKEDIDSMIANLVRLGYEVSIQENYICFPIGNDDTIQEENE